MRVHIQLDDELVQRVDRRVGAGGRSSFIADAVRRALRDGPPWDVIEASIGSIDATRHEWDADPAEWVRQQRQS
jgi:metal-responsive CopG/Arc/MetJ family transcriptional regulator